jgi:hypothetical protein
MSRIGRTVHDWQRIRQPTLVLYGPTATTRMGRITLDRYGYHDLPPTSSNHGIVPSSNVTVNPDTTVGVLPPRPPRVTPEMVSL